MQKNSKTNPSLLKDKEFVATRSKNINNAFKNLLAIGGEIENLTRQIKAEIKPEHKTELLFLQKIKLKIIKLAQFYQEELGCIETIKHNEAEIATGKLSAPPLPVPLFILEEKTWKKFGLTNPWAELKLQKKTMLELAIEHELEQHHLSTDSYKEEQFNQQVESWKQELTLLGVSVQYKTNGKLNQHEFEKLLTSFASKNQLTDSELELDLALEQTPFQKSNPVKAITNIDVEEEMENLTLASEDPHSIDKFLQDMEKLSQLDEVEATIVPSSAVEIDPKIVQSEKYRPKPAKKAVANINLTTVDQEIDELLHQKSTASQTSPVAGYLKRLFTGTLGEIEDTVETTFDTDNKEVVLVQSEEEMTYQQLLLKLDAEITELSEKMNAVIKSSVSCDTQLLEYLRLRGKCIANLLLEKEFLLRHQDTKNQADLEHYITIHLTAKMTLLLTELLESVKESLFTNIAKENQVIRAYNKKHKKQRPLKILNEYEWVVFSKKLLHGADN